MLNFLPVAKVAALPLLTALVVGSCTANHYRTKIDNMELEWRAQVAEAQASAARVAALQARETQRIENEYQASLADLNERYRGAADRLRNASRRSVPTDANAANVADEAASSGGLPDSSGISFEQLAALMQEADKNTQQLLGLQAWVQAALSLESQPEQ